MRPGATHERPPILDAENRGPRTARLSNGAGAPDQNRQEERRPPPTDRRPTLHERRSGLAGRRRPTPRPRTDSKGGPRPRRRLRLEIRHRRRLAIGLSAKHKSPQTGPDGCNRVDPLAPQSARRGTQSSSGDSCRGSRSPAQLCAGRPGLATRDARLAPSGC